MKTWAGFRWSTDSGLVEAALSGRAASPALERASRHDLHLPSCPALSPGPVHRLPRPAGGGRRVLAEGRPARLRLRSRTVEHPGEEAEGSAQGLEGVGGA